MSGKPVKRPVEVSVSPLDAQLQRVLSFAEITADQKVKVVLSRGRCISRVSFSGHYPSYALFLVQAERY